MIFSQSCQYAIKSCIYLARKNEKTDVVEIAEYINSPVSFTSKLLQKLVRKNVISSSKGRSGGFYLSEEQYKKLTIRDIYAAIDNIEQIDKCALGLAECGSDKPCPIHHVNVLIKEKIFEIFKMKICEIKDLGEIAFIER